MGYELFLNKPKKAADYVEVGGTFQCRFCYEETDEARYYPNQSLLSWDCNNCERANNIQEFSLE